MYVKSLIDFFIEVEVIIELYKILVLYFFFFLINCSNICMFIINCFVFYRLCVWLEKIREKLV